MKKFMSVIFVVMFLFVVGRCASSDSDSGSDGNSFLEEEEIITSENHSLIIYLQNSSNELSGFQGDTVSEEIVVLGTDESDDTNFSYAVSGVEGMVVDVDGKLSYAISENSPTGILKDFQILVTNGSGKTGLFNGSVYVMERFNLGEGTIKIAGGDVSSDSGSIVFSIEPDVLSEDVKISISNGCDVSGNPEINIISNVEFDGVFNVVLPDPEYLAQELNCSPEFAKSDSSVQNFFNRFVVKFVNSFTAYAFSEDECTEDKWGIFEYVWQCENKYFAKSRNFRIDNPSSIDWIRGTCHSFFGLLCIKEKTGAVLLGSVSIDDVSLSEKQPVLFIHGFTQGDEIGGGEDTWNLFPKLLEENGEYISFEFKWRTNARFQDVAEDLVSALQMIQEKTDKKVHIIAHSFGGILARIVLQKLYEITDGTSYIASAITFGTPHSGIFDSEKEMHGVNFPQGQDGMLSEFFSNFCRQISCYQMGEDVIFGSIKSLLGVNSDYGKVIADLSDLDSYPLINNFLAKIVIGLIVDEDGNVRNGDGLISYAGQRAHPSFTTSETTPLLLDKNSDYGAIITEVVLDTSGRGYKHSRWNLPLKTPTEVEVYSVNHDSFQLAKDWLDEINSNNSPIANAGFDQNVTIGSTVTLDGSGSNGANLTYSWSIISKPSGSLAIFLNSTSVNPNFTADVGGIYVIQLVVNDGELDSEVDTVSITANLSTDTTYDPSTGLMWQDNGYVVEHDWYDAVSYCEILNLSDYIDWRLPNINELSDLYGKRNQLNSYVSEPYWSSTSHILTSYAYRVDFENGVAGPIGWGKEMYFYVRCVR